MAGTTPKMGFNSYHTLTGEQTYGGTPHLVTSPKYPIIEGGDGLVKTMDVVPIKSVSGVGIMQQHQIHIGAAGPINQEMSFQDFGRFFHAFAGQVEADGAAAPWDAYYVPTRNPYPYGVATLRDDTLYSYDGCIMRTLGLKYSDGGTLDLSTDWFGKSEATPADSAATGSTVVIEPIKASHMIACSSHGISLLNQVREMEINIDLGMDGEHWPGGTATGRGRPRRRSPLTVEIMLTLEFSAEVYEQQGPTGLLKKWHDNEAGVFVVEWNNGGAAAAESEFLVYCPVVKVHGEPHVVDGPGVTIATIRLVAENGTISATDATIGGINGNTVAAYTNAPVLIRVSDDTDPATFTTS